MKEEKPKKISGKKNRWYKLFLNKYLIVGVLFLVWMLFFDSNSWLIHRQLDKQINELEKEERLYGGKLEKETLRINELNADPDAIEKVARERHFLRKENEDVFVIEKKEVKTASDSKTNSKSTQNQ